MAERKRVLVTGAGSAIGAAIVQYAVKDGYCVDLLYRRTALPDEIAAAVEDGPGAIGDAIQCDLSDAASLNDAVTRLAERPYYGLVHNAGVSYDSLVAHADMGRARALMDTNFWSLVALSKALVPAMCRNRCGRVIAISSVTAHTGRKGNALYAASKGAINGFLRSLAAEVASRGVTVNAVLPGPVDTGMLAKYGDMTALTPMQRVGRPDEIGALVRYLLSPEAGFVTGGFQVIDGGLSSCLNK